MQINMTTFGGRARPYIQQTLTSLFASDWQGSGIPVNLIMGSEDEAHVREYLDHPSIRVVPWNLESDRNLRWNCTLNKIRALRWGDDETTLICEDDIAFSGAWLASLQSAAAELRGEAYVLSLFAATPLLKKASLVPGKARIKEYPWPTLQGAQALFYPSRTMRHAVADYLEANLTSACGDDLIGRCARERAALYATSEILVDHVGAVSCFPV